MSKSLESIVEISLRLTDYVLSGVLAFVVLKSIREEVIKDQQTKEDIFISTMITTSRNTMILTVANTIKPNSDSIHLAYLFNCLRDAKKILGEEKYDQIMSCISEFEAELDYISNITKAIVELRDTTVAHIDRKHVNNPLDLFKDQIISWEDMEKALSIISSGLLDLGKHLGLDRNFPDYAQFAKFVLATKTKQIYNLFYR